MAVLVEIHDRAELDRAFNLTSPLLGVNNRNLRTMATDLATGEEMLKDFPADRIAIAESGLNTPRIWPGWPAPVHAAFLSARA